MTDDPWVPDEEMPYRHNPIRSLPWIDSKTEVEVFQHRPGQSQRLAEWCGGSVSFTNQLVVLVPDATEENVLNPARLGDFVVLADGVFHVERAEDGFFQKYWPVGRDPGWTHRCFMSWEGPS